MSNFENFKDLETLINTRERKSRSRSLIDQDQTRKRVSHYPSSLRACKRQLVMDWMGYPEEAPDFNSLITFGFGAAFENVVVKEFKELNIYLGDEESFKLEDKRLKHPFSGRVDVLVKLPPELDEDQLMRPVELKTTSGGQFEDSSYGGYGGRPPLVFPGAKTKPKFYHVDQLTIYLKKMNLDWGLLIYASKENSDYTIYKVYYDQKRYDDIVEYCADVERLVAIAEETGELPPGNTVEDDGSTTQINGTVLDIYKIGEKKGKPKFDKVNRSGGIVKFPCIWQNKDSGKVGYCRFFENCHGDHLKKLNLTIGDLKEVYDEG